MAGISNIKIYRGQPGTGTLLQDGTGTTYTDTGRPEGPQVYGARATDDGSPALTADATTIVNFTRSPDTELGEVDFEVAIIGDRTVIDADRNGTETVTLSVSPSIASEEAIITWYRNGIVLSGQNALVMTNTATAGATYVYDVAYQAGSGGLVRTARASVAVQSLGNRTPLAAILGRASFGLVALTDEDGNGSEVVAFTSASLAYDGATITDYLWRLTRTLTVATWTVVSGGPAFSATIPASQTVQSVTFNTTALAVAADLAACQSTTNSYFQSGTTLNINIGGADPDTGTVTVVMYQDVSTSASGSVSLPVQASDAPPYALLHAITDSNGQPATDTVFFRVVPKPSVVLYPGGFSAAVSGNTTATTVPGQATASLTLTGTTSPLFEDYTGFNWRWYVAGTLVSTDRVWTTDWPVGTTSGYLEVDDGAGVVATPVGFAINIADGGTPDDVVLGGGGPYTAEDSNRDNLADIVLAGAATLPPGVTLTDVAWVDLSDLTNGAPALVLDALTGTGTIRYLPTIPIHQLLLQAEDSQGRTYQAYTTATVTQAVAPLTRTFFVDFENGNDSTGDGTATAPYKTWEALHTAETLTDGDTVYTKGKIREPQTLAGVAGTVFAKWGTSKYVFSGARLITGTWTQVPTTNAWEINIGTGKSVKFAAVNFGAKQSWWGQPAGLVPLAASAAACASTPGTCHYTSGTGVLRLHRLDGSTPNGQTVEWLEGGVNGCVAQNWTNCYIDDFEYELYGDENPGFGNGFRGYGSGNTLAVVQGRCAGHHHALWVDEGPTGSCSTNRIIGKGHGIMTGHTPGGIATVYYTNRANQTGNEWRKLIVEGTAFLDEYARPLHTTSTIGAFYAHTDGDDWPAGAIRAHDCHVRWYHDVGAGSFDFAGSNAASIASIAAAEDPANHAIAFYDCTSTGGIGSVRYDSSCAYVRCKFDYPRASVKGANGVINEAVSTLRYYTYIACDISANLDHATAGASILRAWTNGQTILINSTVYDSGGTTTNGERCIFNPLGATNTTVARGCVLGFANAGTFRKLFKNGPGQPATTALADFDGNAYVNISAGQYCDVATYNTAAEWATQIDTTALDVSGSHFYDARASGHLLLTSTIRASRITNVPGLAADCLNGPNRGSRGCYQYPPTAKTGVAATTVFPTPPLWVITYQTGSHTDNERGMPPAFIDDPEGYNETALRMGRDLGFSSVMTHVRNGIKQDGYWQRTAVSSWSLVSGTVYEATVASTLAVNVVTHLGGTLQETTQAALAATPRSWNKTGSALRINVGGNPTGQEVFAIVNDVYYSIEMDGPPQFAGHDAYWRTTFPAQLARLGYQRWVDYIGPVRENRALSTSPGAEVIDPLVDWQDMEHHLAQARAGGCRRFCYDFLFGTNLDKFRRYHNELGEECWSEPPLVTGTAPNQVIDAANVGKTLWALESWYLGFAEVDTFRVPSGCVAYCIFDYTNFSQAQLNKRIAQGFTPGFLYGPYTAEESMAIARYVRSLGSKRRDYLKIGAL